MLTLLELLGGPDGSTPANQAVPAPQPQPEPGSGPRLKDVTTAVGATHEQQPMNAPQPQRQGTEFNRRGVQIDAVHIPCGDVVHDSTMFVGVIGGVDRRRRVSRVRTGID